MRILNLGTGNDCVQYEKQKDCSIVCVDKLYENYHWSESTNTNIHLEACDIFEFLGNYYGEKFDKVESSRFFEHVDYEKIPELLYLIKNVMKPGAILEVIVPNFSAVFSTFLQFEKNMYEDKENRSFLKKDIKPDKLTPSIFNRLLIDFHTEIFNTKKDPHRCLWSPNLAEYYFKLENFFSTLDIEENVELDNRNWYMKIVAKKRLDK